MVCVAQESAATRVGSDLGARMGPLRLRTTVLVVFNVLHITFGLWLDLTLESLTSHPEVALWGWVGVIN